jgi:hypothetical protein
MTPPERPGTPGDVLFDQRLRDALSPPPEQTGRIVRQALAAAGAGDKRPARAPGLRRLVPSASFLVLLTAAAVLLSLYLGRPRPNAVVSIVNLNGMVIATSAEEERPLTLSGAGEPQSSGIILIRHGDSQ